jgi:hypothetical protein
VTVPDSLGTTDPCVVEDDYLIDFAQRLRELGATVAGARG